MLAALGVPATAAADEIVSVHLVSQGGDAEVSTEAPKRALADDGVTLAAVLGVKVAGKVQYFSEASKVRIGKKTHDARPISEAPPAFLLWFKIEPTAENMSNEASGKFQFESIEYAETPIPTWVFQSTMTADVRPTLTTDRGQGYGTMRYKLVAVTPAGLFSTPGIESRRRRGSGGLTDQVHRVSLRKDDTYLGYLTEMYGQPYIWASAGQTDKTHQTEQLEGSDCADFVVYGQRRMGNKVSYTWTGGLDVYTRKLARGTPNDDGIYIDDDGAEVPFPEVGDLVLFPRHVGVLVEDRGRVGVLDHEDIMVHTLFESPHEQAIGDTGHYATTWIETLRWK